MQKARLKKEDEGQNGGQMGQMEDIHLNDGRLWPMNKTVKIIDYYCPMFYKKPVS